jgi:putative membrane protein
MTDFLGAAYPWIKSFHVISVIAWMAGLFYLPRLFVYHVEQVGHGGATDEMFQTMERRLYRAIMNPSMIATWVFGLMMVFTPGIIDWAQPWVWMKAAGVVGMTWFHHWLGRRRKEFLVGPSPWTGRQFRLMNEVPTVLMVLIVVAVIARPFL